MRNEDKKRELRVNPVAVGLAGAVAGAAAAVAFSDNKTRNKIVKKFGELKDRAVDKLGELDTEEASVKKIKTNGQKKLSSGKRIAKKKLS